MSLNEFIEILKVVIWPIVVLIGIGILRRHILPFLSGSKVKLSLFGQAIETTLPELGRIIEEQTGGSLITAETHYLEYLYDQGIKEYPNGMTSEERKLVRPLRNYGLVMTNPKNSFLGDAKAIQLTSLGRLYMKARRK
jgi:hypothetical protein